MSDSAARAGRHHWDSDAADYHRRHRDYLSGFYWCPEMLAEEDLGLVKDAPLGARVLELGCGSAPCAGALATWRPDLTVVGIDISMGMLRHAGGQVPLVQGDAAQLPFREESFDLAFSVFGAIPFIEDLAALFLEIRRVLRPGGQLVYSCNHPMRWVFPDDPGEAGLVAQIPYWAQAYEERDQTGTLTYAEYQHTFAEHIGALHGAGFHLHSLIEPQWPAGSEHTWGQWSRLRGEVFPGSAIFQATAGTEIPGGLPPRSQ